MISSSIQTELFLLTPRSPLPNPHRAYSTCALSLITAVCRLLRKPRHNRPYPLEHHKVAINIKTANFK